MRPPEATFPLETGGRGGISLVGRLVSRGGHGDTMYFSPAPVDGSQVGPPVLEGAARRPFPATSVIKRLVDVIGALGALVFFAPLLLLVAVLIRFDSRGPALFRQQRGGLNGQSFRIYKFRTMTVQEDGADIRHATRGDQRITRLGGLLRRTSLDELPQLINVLAGDMSLVGPRPHALAHDELYGALLPEYVQRAAAKPGLTGLAQVSGLRGDIADLDMMRDRVSCDLAYIRSWSLWLDVRVIVTTAVKVMFDRSAY
jgi:putative colanic acid biosynthesis UDP-glucose lipid carrier transferase